MGHVTLTTPIWGQFQFVIQRVRLAPVYKISRLAWAIPETWRKTQKCKNGWLGSLEIIHECNYSIQHDNLPFVFHRNRPSSTQSMTHLMLSKVAHFSWRPAWVTPFAFYQDLWPQKTRSLQAIMQHCFNDLRLSPFWQNSDMLCTQGHSRHRGSIASRGKNVKKYFL